jgi:ankyrin repeat protein
MEARKESERAGLFKVPKEIRTAHFGYIEANRREMKRNIDLFFDAIEAKDDKSVETVEDLIRNKGVSPNVKAYIDDLDEREWPALCYAIAINSNITMIECLVKFGADVNGKTCFDNTALHLAAKRGDSEIVRFLIANGANVNAEGDGINDTPLHHAAWRGNIEAVRLLVDNGAIPNAKNDNGNTPRDCAELGAITNTIQVAKAKDNPPDIVGRDDHAAVIKYLSRFGALDRALERVFGV